MKNDISNPEFIKKRTQNIKYMLLKELGYDREDLKIDIVYVDKEPPLTGTTVTINIKNIKYG
jgi:hypothetical protein